MGVKKVEIYPYHESFPFINYSITGIVGQAEKKMGKLTVRMKETMNLE